MESSTKANIIVKKEECKDTVLHNNSISSIAFTTNMEPSANIDVIVKSEECKTNILHDNSINSEVGSFSSRNDNLTEKESNGEDIDDLGFLHELVSDLVDEQNVENENQSISTDNSTNSVEEQSYMETSDDTNSESGDTNSEIGDTDSESDYSTVNDDYTDEDFENTYDSETSGKIYTSIIG